VIRAAAAFRALFSSSSYASAIKRKRSPGGVRPRSMLFVPLLRLSQHHLNRRRRPRPGIWQGETVRVRRAECAAPEAAAAAFTTKFISSDKMKQQRSFA